MILVWHHLEGKAPEWKPEVVPEILDPRLRAPRTHEWTIKSHPQEIMENGVDFAHFTTLHGWKCKAIHWEPDGPYYRLKIDVDTGAEDQAATASVTTDVDSFNSGPGFLYTRFKGEMDGIAVNALTPVGPEKLHIMHRYYAHKRCEPEVVKAFFDFYVNDYNLDVPIWSNKIYRETPLLGRAREGLRPLPPLVPPVLLVSGTRRGVAASPALRSPPARCALRFAALAATSSSVRNSRRARARAGAGRCSTSGFRSESPSETGPARRGAPRASPRAERSPTLS